MLNVSPGREIGPSGSPDAPYIIVGEAPGRVELQTGRPFTGPSGKLLRQLLTSANIKWDDCYLLNVVRVCPKRSITDFLQFNKKGVSESEEFRRYCDILYAAIDNADGKIIIPLGSTALWAICRERDIMKRRGSIYYSHRFPGRTIIPSVHPSAALRSYIQRYPILHDLCRAKKEHDNPQPLPNYNLIIEPTFDEAMRFLKECEDSQLVAFDIETAVTTTDGKFTDWEMTCFSLGLRCPNGETSAICIPLVTQGGSDYFTLEHEASIIRAMAKILQAPEISILGQNLMFDAYFLLWKYGIQIKGIEDTMLAQNLVNPDFPKGLDFLCSIYTRQPYYKDEGKQHRKYGGPLNSFWRYSALDSAVLFEIWDALIEDMKLLTNQQTYQSMRDMYYPLLFMIKHGIPFNKDGALSASGAIRAQIEDLQNQINCLLGRELNPNSPLQLKRYFYEESKLTPYRKNKAITTDEDALKRIVSKGIPIVSEVAGLVLDIRGLVKLTGTYMEMATDEDGRIRSSISPAITKTGRLSSRQTIFGTGGNVQNLPPEFKRFLTADKDYILYNADLAQAENRLVAFYAPEPRMREAFDLGIDVHSLTGSMLSGLSPQEVEDEHKDHIPCEIGNGNKTWRYWGKMCNHALNYGLGPNTFALRLEIPVYEAKLLIQRYHLAYPGVRQYHKWVQLRLSEDRSITNPFGRTRKFLDGWGTTLFQTAYAHLPQSTVGDIINQWGILPIYQDQDTFHPVCLLNQVHDSIVFQIPSTLPWEAHIALLGRIKQNVEQPIHWRGDQTVIPLEFELGLNMGTMEPIPELTTDCLKETWSKINVI